MTYGKTRLRALTTALVTTVLAATTISTAATAFADPAPQPGEACVPVRIISADGTWSKGDKKYLNMVINKAKQVSGGNISTTTAKVEGPYPTGAVAKNSLPSGTTTMIYAYNGSGPVQPGTASEVVLALQLDASVYNDAGIQTLLDDGWIPGTSGNVKALMRQSTAALTYNFLIQHPPVVASKKGDVSDLVLGYDLFYKNDADRNAAKDAWSQTGLAARSFPGETYGSKRAATSAVNAQKSTTLDGKKYMSKIRSAVTEGTLRVITQSEKLGTDLAELKSVMDSAAKAAARATEQNPSPQPAKIPADIATTELADIPDPWTGENPNVAVANTTTDAAAPTTAPGDGGTLNGVPRGNAAKPTTSTGTPQVAPNSNAPTTTDEPTTTAEQTTTTAETTPGNVTTDATTSPATTTQPTTTNTSTNGNDGYNPSPTKVTGDSKYDTQKAKTNAALAAVMKRVHKECPSTMFALLGAREGAGAIGDLASDIGNGRGPVPADKVIAVGLISDPERAAMTGKEDTVPDYNKLCVADGKQATTTTVSATPTAVNKGGGQTQVAAPTTTKAATPTRTLGQSCSTYTQGGSPSSPGQLVGKSVDGAGVYGQRTNGMGDLAGRTATLCVASDADCATSRANSLVSLIAESIVDGNLNKSGDILRSTMLAGVGLLNLLKALDIGQITNMSGDVQKIIVNAPLLATAVGSLIALPNPASAAAAIAVGIPTAQGVLGITGGVLNIAGQLVTAYESTPQLPQIVDFINLINPDTAIGKKILAKIPGGSSTQVTAALRFVVPILNALNSIPKGQVLSLSGDIAKTVGAALTDPSQLLSLLSQCTQLFSTVISAFTSSNSAATGAGLFSTVASVLDPNSASSQTKAPVDYSTATVNNKGTTGTDWMGTWLGNQTKTAVNQNGTTGVTGDANFGGSKSSTTGDQSSTAATTTPATTTTPTTNYSGTPG